CGQVRISGFTLPPWFSTASCRPRKLEAQFIERYSMSSDFMTSTMKSPPLLVWLTGSFTGDMVSTAASWGPGGAALVGGLACGVATVAAAGVVSAAAPASVADFRKLRRPTSVFDFDMASSRKVPVLIILQPVLLRRTVAPAEKSVKNAERRSAQ